MSIKKIKAKQQNSNDENFKLIEWFVKPGDKVKKNEIICAGETTKALFDLEAEDSGYFYPVVEEGEEVDFVSVIYFLSDKKIDNYESQIQKIKLDSDREKSKEETKVKNWTIKAEILAKRHGINIEDVKGIGRIQESDVLIHIEQITNKKSTTILGDMIDDVFQANRQTRIIIIGAGRGAVQVIDAINRLPNMRTVGIVDSNNDLLNNTLMGVKIIGDLKSINKLKSSNIFDEAIIAFSNDIDARTKVFNELKEKEIQFANIIDPSVSIHSNYDIGEGNIIIANSRVGACAVIGDNNFFSAFTGIEHHCKIGSGCTFGPGVITSSRVYIGDKVKFGTGIFIEPGINIGDNSIVASGSILTIDVPADSICKSRIETTIRAK